MVEVENTETWTWFMEIFFADVGCENGNSWVFMSDKQKGLGQAIRDLMPTTEQRHFVRHLHNNFKIVGHNGLALKQKLWVAARSTTIPTFEAEIEITDGFKKGQQIIGVGHTSQFILSVICFLTTCGSLLTQLLLKQRISQL
ncbi:unnamed protein product [Prunus armeniaca]